MDSDDIDIGGYSLSTFLEPGDFESIEATRLYAPENSGVYYIGACVESVEGEANTNNNCSSVIQVTVGADGQGPPDLEVYSPSVYDKVFDPGERFNMAFWVRNQGVGPSNTTASLKYYRSEDSTIGPSDNELTPQGGTSEVGPISESGKKHGCRYTWTRIQAAHSTTGHVLPLCQVKRTLRTIAQPCSGSPLRSLTSWFRPRRLVATARNLETSSPLAPLCKTKGRARLLPPLFVITFPSTQSLLPATTKLART